MSAQLQARYWLLALAVSLVLIWLLSSILLPFVAGMAVAYFLDPPADKLEERGLSRGLSATIIGVGFFVLLILAALLLGAVLRSQVSGVSGRAAGWLAPVG